MTNAMNVNVMTELEITNSALAVGWVKFSYYKADGTKRVAIGTRNHELIRLIIGDRNSESRSNGFFQNCNGYFDLTKCAFRQFHSNRFIGLELEKLDTTQAIYQAVKAVLDEDKTDEKALDEIGFASVRLLGSELGNEIFEDSRYEWCKEYNGGRYLDGEPLRYVPSNPSLLKEIKHETTEPKAVATAKVVATDTIDWEQRRFELLKAIMSFQLCCKISDAELRDLAQNAIRLADITIAELRK